MISDHRSPDRPPISMFNLTQQSTEFTIQSAQFTFFGTSNPTHSIVEILHEKHEGGILRCLGERVEKPFDRRWRARMALLIEIMNGKETAPARRSR